MDVDQARACAFRVWGSKQGEGVSLMIHLGDRLGLYRALRGAGAVSSDQLAARTGLHERWLREWLRGQAAAGLLDSADGETFELTDEAAAVLADEDDSLLFAAGAFTAPFAPDIVDRIADAFRTGVGLSYDQLGPTAVHRTERMLGPWARLALVPVILPALDGVVSKLEAGARAVDVGCGAGVALLTMAEAYPNSEFHGYDPSHNAIERARTKVADSGLSNVVLHEGRGEDLPPGAGFDFVITFDCLHDMTNPAGAIAAIRGAIADDGTWLIKDIRSAPSFAENRKNPVLAMLYSFSVMSCMSSALSEPGGAGLGTLGLNTDVAERMVREAGFNSFDVHDFEDPANLSYEVRP